VVVSGHTPSSSPSTRSHATILTLRDSHGQEAGSLLVELLELTPQTDEATVATGDTSYNGDRGQDVPSPEPVHYDVEDSGSVLNSLKQVVNKAKFAANSVDETDEVRFASFSYRHVASVELMPSLSSLILTQELLGGSWSRHTRYEHLQILALMILIGYDRRRRSRSIEPRRSGSSSHRWSTFIQVSTPGTKLKVRPGVPKTLSSESRCKRSNAAFSFCIIPSVQVRRVILSSASQWLSRLSPPNTSSRPAAASNRGHS